jgi:GNAT superfamily N-acetyltransferase
MQEAALEQTELHRGVVRRLFPTDLGEFKAHLLRLGPTARRERFGMAVSDDFIEQYADRCFGIDDVIYGYIEDRIVRGAGELRGIGHNLPLGFGGSAEAAFSVEKEWRRRGIGRELMARIVRAARNRRADTLYMSCLVTNAAMLSLARKFSAELRIEPDESRGCVAPLAPSADSLMDEARDDVTGFATAMVDLHRRVLGAK